MLDGGPNSLNMLYAIVFILFSYYIVLLLFGFIINFINLKIKCNFPPLPLILVCIHMPLLASLLSYCRLNSVFVLIFEIIILRAL